MGQRAANGTREEPVAITDLPLFSMLRTRMQWHQERQRLLAENVANADTPNFRPRDLAPLQFDRMRPMLTSVALDRTENGHIAASSSGSSRFQAARFGGYEVRPAGNAINLEDEMIKVAANQMDYQAATTLYTRSINLIKTAIGKR
jgi:flagellar basal-body rod protein FlgB